MKMEIRVGVCGCQVPSLSLVYIKSRRGISYTTKLDILSNKPDILINR